MSTMKKAAANTMMIAGTLIVGGVTSATSAFTAATAASMIQYGDYEAWIIPATGLVLTVAYARATTMAGRATLDNMTSDHKTKPAPATPEGM